MRTANGSWLPLPAPWLFAWSLQAALGDSLQAAQRRVHLGGDGGSSFGAQATLESFESLFESLERPYHQLFDSAYSLVLHGHGRWSYRLMEALNGGSIPVIMAEGWELPLKELIDWEQISVRRPEALGLDPKALVSSLPRDQGTIESTRSRLREVYRQIFETQEQRLTSLLRSAALWKRNWQRNERETLRMLVEKASEARIELHQVFKTLVPAFTALPVAQSRLLASETEADQRLLQGAGPRWPELPLESLDPRPGRCRRVAGRVERLDPEGRRCGCHGGEPIALSDVGRSARRS